MCRMNRWQLLRICLKLMDQICSLMETTTRQRAGESGLPIGLPRHCRMHFWPKANVCIFKADLRRSGTSLMTIFLVTLSRRKVRPFMMSPALLVFLDRPRMLRCPKHPCEGTGNQGAWTRLRWSDLDQCWWRSQRGLDSPEWGRHQRVQT